MKKYLAILVSVILVLGILSSCGGASAGTDNAQTTAEVSEPETLAADAGGAGYEMLATESLEEGELSAQYGLKIVYESSIDIETLDFDKSCADILAAVSEYGGYVSSQNSGGGYRYANDRYSSRYAEFVLRIPSERHTEFLQCGGEFGNVTHTANSEQDITSQYIDAEARLDSLRAQEARLLEMLDITAELDDLLLLEDHLAEVRYEIERYTSTLMTYENLTSYSTITIYLSEVSTITNTSDSFGARLKNALTGSLYELGEFLQDLVITLIYALPYLILLALAALIVCRTIRRRRMKQAAKRALLEDAMRQNQTGREQDADR